MFCFRSSITGHVKSIIRSINFRNLYGVHHDPGVFYVRLPKDGTNDRAVLLYKQTGVVLDMYAVKVPKKHEGQGFGRLLAEVNRVLVIIKRAAFTYVIVRNYRMYLTCTYLQRYYKTIKTQHLSAYILGPPNILGGPYPVSMVSTIEADKLEGMPDPTDTDNMFNKD